MENYELRKLIAERVRYFRLKKGMSQEKLSEKAELEIKYINKLENQKYNLKIDTLEQVINALDISFDEFFNLRFSSSSDEIDELLDVIANIPKNDQLVIIKSILSLIKMSSAE
ncbi:helix-turn-helix transcriptional regulator [Enterococcus raffinosus]|uniref:helix-turn-helix domain-containing protein n=1 Tax=Enterococcus raffinosus TaxID=71452 RepID=UPI0028FD7227|nr:hypothetical protein NUITMVRE36_01310 [Enterococcus raffinosus]